MSHGKSLRGRAFASPAPDGFQTLPVLPTCGRDFKRFQIKLPGSGAPIFLRENPRDCSAWSRNCQSARNDPGSRGEGERLQ